MAEKSGSKLEVLYATSIEEATRLAYLLTGDGHLAEDIAQDAFIRATGRFQHLRDQNSFTAYLRRAVLNGCRAHWRRQRVERRHLERARTERPRTIDPPDVGSRSEIVNALNALQPRQRMAVVLRHYVDLSERQTADLMSCSLGTVKSLTSRGLQALRDVMGSRER